MVGLVAGGAALLLLAAVAVVVVVRFADAASTEPDKASTPSNALKGYLDAVAAGDAAKANRYAWVAPGDSPTLASEFLKAALAKNPITDITVPATPDTGTTSYATADFRIGATVVHGGFYLTKNPSGVWKLNRVVTEVARPVEWGKLAMTINGVESTSPKIALFPGAYTLGTGTSLLEFPTPTFTVVGPAFTPAGLSASIPQLTDKGRQTMIATSQEWLAQCLSAQNTDPAGCGMKTSLPAGATLATGTVRRTVTSAGTPCADAQPLAAIGDPTKVTMGCIITIAVEAKDTAGTVYSGKTGVASVKGTINGESITVVFDE